MSNLWAPPHRFTAEARNSLVSPENEVAHRVSYPVITCADHPLCRHCLVPLAHFGGHGGSILHMLRLLYAMLSFCAGSVLCRSAHQEICEPGGN